jgi:hypothetical protein
LFDPYLRWPGSPAKRRPGSECSVWPRQAVAPRPFGLFSVGRGRVSDLAGTRALRRDDDEETAIHQRRGGGTARGGRGHSCCRHCHRARRAAGRQHQHHPGRLAGHPRRSSDHAWLPAYRIGGKPGRERTAGAQRRGQHQFHPGRRYQHEPGHADNQLHLAGGRVRRSGVQPRWDARLRQRGRR